MADKPPLFDGRPRPQRWNWSFATGAAATLGSALVVGYAVTTVHDLFGGISSWLGLAFASVFVGLGFAYSAWRAQTWIATLPLFVFPAVTWVWCRLAFRIPGSGYAKTDLDGYGARVGPPYSELGPVGVSLVMASMAAVVAMFWALGDRRVGRRVAASVALAVSGAHALVVLWLLGRPEAW